MLTPIIYKKSETPIYMQIRHFVVAEINAGHLLKADKMPSVRGLADHLKLSCTTIENAYNQLLAEGYIESKAGKGYFVEAVEGIESRSITSLLEPVEQSPKRDVYDFAKEYIAKDAFDFRLWKKHVNHVLNYEQEQLCAYGALRGEPILREAISRQFYRSRGVVAAPAQIVVGSGVTPLLAMLSRLFHERDIQRISIENPGFRKAFGVFKANGMKISPVEVSFEGLDTDTLYTSDSRACYVSPSHHFPTGFIMPVSERQKILRWATVVDGYIIEDDYNFELRFEGQPIPAMQGMDTDDRVIYLGSFSTVLAPAIRISFMVLPKALDTLFEESAGMFPQTASKIEQLALAALINSGDFDKHVRKIRKMYTRKQQNILSYIDRYMPKVVRPMKVKSGLQILLKLPEGLSEAAMVEACRDLSVGIEGLSQYSRTQERPMEQYLIVGYRGIEESMAEEGIKRIGQAAWTLLNKENPYNI